MSNENSTIKIPQCIVPNNIDIKNNRFIQSIDNNYSLEKKNVYNQVMKKGLLDNSKVSHDLVDLIVKATEYTKTNYHYL